MLKVFCSPKLASSKLAPNLDEHKIIKHLRHLTQKRITEVSVVSVNLSLSKPNENYLIIRCLCSTTTPVPSSSAAIPSPMGSGTSFVGGVFWRYAFGMNNKPRKLTSLHKRQGKTLRFKKKSYLWK